MKKSIILFILLIVFLPTVLFGQTSKVGIAQFGQDSLRVSVDDLIRNPVISISGLEDYKLVSYRLVLNINGAVYEKTLTKDTLEKEQLQMLSEVRNDMPMYNQLFIEQVKYRKPDDSIETAEGLYLWLAKETNCKGVFDIEEVKYKRNEQVRFEYHWCNDTCVKVNNYKKDGTFIGSKEYSFEPDTIVVTQLYRKDGSKIIYERQVNGKDDGDYIIYYPDGSIKLEAKNVNGIRVHERIYDKNNRMISESKCNSDTANCTCATYGKDGSVKKTKPFKYGGIKYKIQF